MCGQGGDRLDVVLCRGELGSDGHGRWPGNDRVAAPRLADRCTRLDRRGRAGMDDRLVTAASRVSARSVPQAPAGSPIFRSSRPLDRKRNLQRQTKNQQQASRGQAPRGPRRAGPAPVADPERVRRNDHVRNRVPCRYVAAQVAPSWLLSVSAKCRRHSRPERTPDERYR